MEIYLCSATYFYPLPTKVKGDIGILSSIRPSPPNICFDEGYRLCADCLMLLCKVVAHIQRARNFPAKLLALTPSDYLQPNIFLQDTI